MINFSLVVKSFSLIKKKYGDKTLTTNNNKKFDLSSLAFLKEYIDQPGIYALRNKTNQRRYIGKTKDLQNRFNEHFETHLYNNHLNEYLQQDFNEFGINAFIFEVLEEVNLTKLFKLTAREKFWINQFPSNLLYNKQVSSNSNTSILRKETKVSNDNNSEYFSLVLLDRHVDFLGWKEGDKILHQLSEDKEGILLERV